MADLPSDRLGLRAASEHLLVQPRVLLHCVKKVVRPNGGTLLPAIDVEGDTHFLRSDLEAFDADLRKQWVHPPDTKRVAIPQVFQEALRFEALTKCGLCGALYATEFAHI
jgi:hypothetical protein